MHKENNLKDRTLEKALKYLNNNSNRDKNYLINKLNLKFGYIKNKAIKIYYYWKSKFMKTINCIPRAIVCSSNRIKLDFKPKFKTKGNLIIGEYGEYKNLEGCIVVGNHFFNNIQEIEAYRNFRDKSNLNSIDNILDEAIEIMELVGLV